MSISKEDLKKVRDFIKNNPERAYEIVKSSPELLNMLQVNSGVSQTKSNQLTKSIPGIPKMYDENGFSNYALLAFIAFAIQFAITLICIFFYK